MAGNQVVLTFAGDEKQLSKATQAAGKDVEGVGKSVTSAADDFKKGSAQSANFTDKIGKLGAGVTGMTSAIDDASSAVSSLAQIQSAAKEKAAAHARALSDVAQAEEDMRQATRDASQAQIDAGQAQIDAKQATLDVATAQAAYTAAVHQHGLKSAEASQASIDLLQAQQDLKQATEDGKQATEDGKQATIDATTAQLDLNDATRAAHPPATQKWADDITMVTPLLSGLVGVLGLATAAQWLWNIAMSANPIVLITLAVIALVAVIVLIATKTTWFQRLWHAAWGGIKTSAESVWNWLKKIPGWIKTAFLDVTDFITAPFRHAFNTVSDAWNNTIGKLHWSVPSWIPGLGGHSIGVPHLPHFHQGGLVPGVPGSEMLAVLQAGERVTPAAAGGMTMRVAGDGALAVLLRQMFRTGAITAYDSAGQRVVFT